MHPAFIKSNIKLTIGILVSNHKQYIRKVMEGIRPLLEQVSCELIVIDTKGAESDGSIDIVREYTNQIYPFTWCDDFSAARNFCLDHAKGEWFLYQDDDEWFDDVQEFIDFFNSKERENYYSGTYYTRDYSADGKYSVGIAGRIIRRTNNTRFVGRVHENFNEIFAPRKDFSCFTHHYGYAYENTEQRIAKQTRNVAILKEEIKENGITPKRAAQLVQEYLGLEHTTEEGLEFAKRYLEEQKGTEAEKNKNVQWIISVVARRYGMDNRYEELLAWVDYVKRSYWCSPLTMLVMGGVVANAASGRKDYAVALRFSLEYVEQKDWLQDHEEEKKKMLQLDLPMFLTEEYYFLILRIGVFSANQLQEYPVAMGLWNRFPWKREDFDKDYYRSEMLRTVQGLRAQQQQKKEKPQLTIGILVSNRKQYIREVMEGISPLLEQLPCELIAVDTKGAEGDGSIDIVREYTDKIYPFVWCNDFSAARNVCLDHAQGEWFMYLDDDECFADVQEIVDFFKRGEYKNYKSGYYYVRDYTAAGTYSVGIVGRMVCRTEQTRFVGKVHETFNKIEGPSKQFSCYVKHYGYVFADSTAAKVHQNRNVSILREELQNVGETPRICAQLVQELLYLPETQEEGFAFAVKMLEKHKEAGWQMDSCAQWMMLATIRYFNRKHDYKGAAGQLELLKETCELTEMAWLTISGTMANLASEQEDYPAVLSYVQRYLAAYDWREENAEQAMVQMNLDMPKYVEREYYYNLLKLGALAADRLQKTEQVLGFLERLPEKEREKIMEPKKKQPKLIRSDIKLTVGMLVSNHKQYIRKAMEALKPLLEAVPSELIVIDTMGEASDGSIDIVREYTDKIYPFTWCNDFSAARNFCLDHAKGEWFLYQDDDEWFDDVQEFIDFFNSEECERYYSGYYYTRDYLPGNQYSTGIAGRIIRRMDNTRFIGRVHENFNETFAPNKEFSCFTHHYGYAYENAEQKAAKQKRNMDILKEEIREKGLTPPRAAQMAQELLSRDETLDEGLNFCEESIKALEQSHGLKHACCQWMLVAMARYHILKGETKQMLEQAEKIRRNYDLTQIAEMVLAANAVPAAAETGNYDAVAKYCDIYFKGMDWKCAHEDEALLQTNLDFPRYLTEEYYHNLIHMAAVTANNRGDFEAANRYWKRMPFGIPGFDSSRYAVEMGRTMQGLKNLKEKQLLAAKLKEIMALLDSILEAEDYLRTTIAAGNSQEQQELLAGMQEAAITVGTTLDGLLGEGTKEVTLLEKYCELVWQCNNEALPEQKLLAADEMRAQILLVKEALRSRM